MVFTTCAGTVRTALYRCACALVRLLPPEGLPAACDRLAAPAATACHLHTLATAVEKQSNKETRPFVCELYVRALTAGMNELERLKLKPEKEADTRIMEQTLAAWFMQLAELLHDNARISNECALTAFSVHPSQPMYARLCLAPAFPLPVKEAVGNTASTSEFGSWASDSRPTKTNFVKTSGTLDCKAGASHAVSSTVLEGEGLGLGADLCEDLAALLSGPRVKTLTWDMERDQLLENCRAYMKRTGDGTRGLTTELKYLNLDPAQFQHLPEHDYEDENDLYYGIEKGYEHLVDLLEPEDAVWTDSYLGLSDLERSENSQDSSFESEKCKQKRKHKKNPLATPAAEVDPLSLETIREKQCHSKERHHSKDKTERIGHKGKHKKDNSLKLGENGKDSASIERLVKKQTDEVKTKKEDKEQKIQRDMEDEQAKPKVLASLIGLKVCSKSGVRTENIVKKICSKKERRKREKEERKRFEMSKGFLVSNQLHHNQHKPWFPTTVDETEDSKVVFDGLFSMEETKTMPSSSKFIHNTEPMGSKSSVKHINVQGAVTTNQIPQSTEHSNTNIKTVIQKPLAFNKGLIEQKTETPNMGIHRHSAWSDIKKDMYIPGSVSTTGSPSKSVDIDVKNKISNLLKFRRQNVNPVNYQKAVQNQQTSLLNYSTATVDTNNSAAVSAVSKNHVQGPHNMSVEYQKKTVFSTIVPKTLNKEMTFSQTKTQRSNQQDPYVINTYRPTVTKVDSSPYKNQISSNLSQQRFCLQTTPVKDIVKKSIVTANISSSQQSFIPNSGRLTGLVIKYLGKTEVTPKASQNNDTLNNSLHHQIKPANYPQKETTFGLIKDHIVSQTGSSVHTSVDSTNSSISSSKPTTLYNAYLSSTQKSLLIKPSKSSATYLEPSVHTSNKLSPTNLPSPKIIQRQELNQVQKPAISSGETSNESRYDSFLKELKATINAGTVKDMPDITSPIEGRARVEPKPSLQAYLNHKVSPNKAVTLTNSSEVKHTKCNRNITQDLSQPSDLPPVPIAPYVTVSPKCAKQKCDNAPNTFSRLSYMHKSKQSEVNKQKHIIVTGNAPPTALPTQHAVLKEVDNQLNNPLPALLLQGQLSISRVDKNPRANERVHMAKPDVTLRKLTETKQLEKGYVGKPSSASSQSASENPILVKILQNTNDLKMNKYSRVGNASEETISLSKNTVPSIANKPTHKQLTVRQPLPNTSQSYLTDNDQKEILGILLQKNKMVPNQPATMTVKVSNPEFNLKLNSKQVIVTSASNFQSPFDSQIKPKTEPYPHNRNCNISSLSSHIPASPCVTMPSHNRNITTQKTLVYGESNQAMVSDGNSQYTYLQSPKSVTNISPQSSYPDSQKSKKFTDISPVQLPIKLQPYEGNSQTKSPMLNRIQQPAKCYGAMSDIKKTKTTDISDSSIPDWESVLNEIRSHKTPNRTEKTFRLDNKPGKKEPNDTSNKNKIRDIEISRKGKLLQPSPFGVIKFKKEKEESGMSQKLIAQVPVSMRKNQLGSLSSQVKPEPNVISSIGIVPRYHLVTKATPIVTKNTVDYPYLHEELDKDLIEEIGEITSDEDTCSSTQVFSRITTCTSDADTSHRLSKLLNAKESLESNIVHLNKEISMEKIKVESPKTVSSLNESKQVTFKNEVLNLFSKVKTTQPNESLPNLSAKQTYTGTSITHSKENMSASTAIETAINLARRSREKLGSFSCSNVSTETRNIIRTIPQDTQLKLNQVKSANDIIREICYKKSDGHKSSHLRDSDFNNKEMNTIPVKYEKLTSKSDEMSYSIDSKETKSDKPPNSMYMSTLYDTTFLGCSSRVISHSIDTQNSANKEETSALLKGLDQSAVSKNLDDLNYQNLVGLALTEFDRTLLNSSEIECKQTVQKHSQDSDQNKVHDAFIKHGALKSVSTSISDDEPELLQSETMSIPLLHNLNLDEVIPDESKINVNQPMHIEEEKSPSKSEKLTSQSKTKCIASDIPTVPCKSDSRGAFFVRFLSKEQEDRRKSRLLEKRNRILNREVIHKDQEPPIPLTYEPLDKISARDKKNTNDIETNDKPLLAALENNENLMVNDQLHVDSDSTPIIDELGCEYISPTISSTKSESERNGPVLLDSASKSNKFDQNTLQEKENNNKNELSPLLIISKPTSENKLVEIKYLHEPKSERDKTILCINKTDRIEEITTTIVESYQEQDQSDTITKPSSSKMLKNNITPTEPCPGELSHQTALILELNIETTNKIQQLPSGFDSLIETSNKLTPITEMLISTEEIILPKPLKNEESNKKLQLDEKSSTVANEPKSINIVGAMVTPGESFSNESKLKNDVLDVPQHCKNIDKLNEFIIFSNLPVDETAGSESIDAVNCDRTLRRSTQDNQRKTELNLYLQNRTDLDKTSCAEPKQETNVKTQDITKIDQTIESGLNDLQNLKSPIENTSSNNTKGDSTSLQVDALVPIPDVDVYNSIKKLITQSKDKQQVRYEKGYKESNPNCKLVPTKDEKQDNKKDEVSEPIIVRRILLRSSNKITNDIKMVPTDSKSRRTAKLKATLKKKAKKKLTKEHNTTSDQLLPTESISKCSPAAEETIECEAAENMVEADIGCLNQNKKDLNLYNSDKNVSKRRITLRSSTNKSISQLPKVELIDKQLSNEPKEIIKGEKEIKTLIRKDKNFNNSVEIACVSSVEDEKRNWQETKEQLNKPSKIEMVPSSCLILNKSVDYDLAQAIEVEKSNLKTNLIDSQKLTETTSNISMYGSTNVKYLEECCPDFMLTDIEDQIKSSRITKIDPLNIENQEQVDLPTETTKQVELPTETTKQVELPTETTKPVELPTESTKQVELPTESTKQVELPTETTSQTKKKQPKKSIVKRKRKALIIRKTSKRKIVHAKIDEGILENSTDILTDKSYKFKLTSEKNIKIPTDNISLCNDIEDCSEKTLKVNVQEQSDKCKATDLSGQSKTPVLMPLPSLTLPLSPKTSQLATGPEVVTLRQDKIVEGSIAQSSFLPNCVSKVKKSVPCGNKADRLKCTESIKITMGREKAYLATVTSNKTTTDIKALFEDPAFKSTLGSILQEKNKSYTINIKELCVKPGSKVKRPSEIVVSTISTLKRDHQVNLVSKFRLNPLNVKTKSLLTVTSSNQSPRPIGTNKLLENNKEMEVINLVSDDDDEDIQTCKKIRIGNRYIPIIPINESDLKIHQLKFDKKCQVHLEKSNFENLVKRHNLILNKINAPSKNFQRCTTPVSEVIVISDSPVKVDINNKVDSNFLNEPPKTNKFKPPTIMLDLNLSDEDVALETTISKNNTEHSTMQHGAINAEENTNAKTAALEKESDSENTQAIIVESVAATQSPDASIPNFTLQSADQNNDETSKDSSTSAKTVLDDITAITPESFYGELPHSIPQLSGNIATHLTITKDTHSSENVVDKTSRAKKKMNQTVGCMETPSSTKNLLEVLNPSSQLYNREPISQDQPELPYAIVSNLLVQMCEEKSNTTIESMELTSEYKNIEDLTTSQHHSYKDKSLSSHELPGAFETHMLRSSLNNNTDSICEDIESASSPKNLLQIIVTNRKQHSLIQNSQNAPGLSSALTSNDIPEPNEKNNVPIESVELSRLSENVKDFASSKQCFCEDITQTLPINPRAIISDLLTPRIEQDTNTKVKATESPSSTKDSLQVLDPNCQQDFLEQNLQQEPQLLRSIVSKLVIQIVKDNSTPKVERIELSSLSKNLKDLTSSEQNLCEETSQNSPILPGVIVSSLFTPKVEKKIDATIESKSLSLTKNSLQILDGASQHYFLKEDLHQEPELPHATVSNLEVQVVKDKSHTTMEGIELSSLSDLSGNEEDLTCSKHHLCDEILQTSAILLEDMVSDLSTLEVENKKNAIVKRSKAPSLTKNHLQVLDSNSQHDFLKQNSQQEPEFSHGVVEDTSNAIVKSTELSNSFENVKDLTSSQQRLCVEVKQSSLILPEVIVSDLFTPKIKNKNYYATVESTESLSSTYNSLHVLDTNSQNYFLEQDSQQEPEIPNPSVSNLALHIVEDKNNTTIESIEISSLSDEVKDLATSQQHSHKDSTWDFLNLPVTNLNNFISPCVENEIHQTAESIDSPKSTKDLLCLLDTNSQQQSVEQILQDAADLSCAFVSSLVVAEDEEKSNATVESMELSSSSKDIANLTTSQQHCPLDKAQTVDEFSNVLESNLLKAFLKTNTDETCKILESTRPPKNFLPILVTNSQQHFLVQNDHDAREPSRAVVSNLVEPESEEKSNATIQKSELSSSLKKNDFFTTSQEHSYKDSLLPQDELPGVIRTRPCLEINTDLTCKIMEPASSSENMLLTLVTSCQEYSLAENSQETQELSHDIVSNFVISASEENSNATVKSLQSLSLPKNIEDSTSNTKTTEITEFPNLTNNLLQVLDFNRQHDFFEHNLQKEPNIPNTTVSSVVISEFSEKSNTIVKSLESLSSSKNIEDTTSHPKTVEITESCDSISVSEEKSNATVERLQSSSSPRTIEDSTSIRKTTEIKEFPNITKNLLQVLDFNRQHDFEHNSQKEANLPNSTVSSFVMSKPREKSITTVESQNLSSSSKNVKESTCVENKTYQTAESIISPSSTKNLLSLLDSNTEQQFLEKDLQVAPELSSAIVSNLVGPESDEESNTTVETLELSSASMNIKGFTSSQKQSYIVRSQDSFKLPSNIVSNLREPRDEKESNPTVKSAESSSQSLEQTLQNTLSLPNLSDFNWHGSQEKTHTTPESIEFLGTSEKKDFTSSQQHLYKESSPTLTEVPGAIDPNKIPLRVGNMTNQTSKSMKFLSSHKNIQQHFLEEKSGDRPHLSDVSKSIRQMTADNISHAVKRIKSCTSEKIEDFTTNQHSYKESVNTTPSIIKTDLLEPKIGNKTNQTIVNREFNSSPKNLLQVLKPDSQLHSPEQTLPNERTVEKEPFSKSPKNMEDDTSSQQHFHEESTRLLSSLLDTVACSSNVKFTAKDNESDTGNVKEFTVHSTSSKLQKNLMISKVNGIIEVEPLEKSLHANLAIPDVDMGQAVEYLPSIVCCKSDKNVLCVDFKVAECEPVAFYSDQAYSDMKNSEDVVNILEKLGSSDTYPNETVLHNQHLSTIHKSDHITNEDISSMLASDILNNDLKDSVQIKKFKDYPSFKSDGTNTLSIHPDTFKAEQKTFKVSSLEDTTKHDIENINMYFDCSNTKITSEPSVIKKCTIYEPESTNTSNFDSRIEDAFYNKTKNGNGEFKWSGTKNVTSDSIGVVNEKQETISNFVVPRLLSIVLKYVNYHSSSILNLSYQKNVTSPKYFYSGEENASDTTSACNVTDEDKFPVAVISEKKNTELFLVVDSLFSNEADKINPKNFTEREELQKQKKSIVADTHLGGGSIMKSKTYCTEKVKNSEPIETENSINKTKPKKSVCSQCPMKNLLSEQTVTDLIDNEYNISSCDVQTESILTPLKSANSPVSNIALSVEVSIVRSSDKIEQWFTEEDKNITQNSCTSKVNLKHDPPKTETRPCANHKKPITDSCNLGIVALEKSCTKPELIINTHYTCSGIDEEKKMDNIVDKSSEDTKLYCNSNMNSTRSEKVESRCINITEKLCSPSLMALDDDSDAIQNRSAYSSDVDDEMIYLSNFSNPNYAEHNYSKPVIAEPESLYFFEGKQLNISEEMFDIAMRQTDLSSPIEYIDGNKGIKQESSAICRVDDMHTVQKNLLNYGGDSINVSSYHKPTREKKIYQELYNAEVMESDTSIVTCTHSKYYETKISSSSTYHGNIEQPTLQLKNKQKWGGNINMIKVKCDQSLSKAIADTNLPQLTRQQGTTLSLDKVNSEAKTGKSIDTFEIYDDDSVHFEPTKVISYSVASKRKVGMKDIHIDKKKFRKSVNINLPKQKNRRVIINTTSYRNDIVKVMAYDNALKLTYKQIFFRSDAEIDENSLWRLPLSNIEMPSKSLPTDHAENIGYPSLFFDDQDESERTNIIDIHSRSLVDEITQCDLTEDVSIDQTDEKVGFGEESSRVNKSLKERISATKVSAATLLDVKKNQPFLLSESPEKAKKYNITIHETPTSKKRFSNYHLRSKLKLCLEKEKEINNNCLKQSNYKLRPKTKNTPSLTKKNSENDKNAQNQIRETNFTNEHYFSYLNMRTKVRSYFEQNMKEETKDNISNGNKTSCTKPYLSNMHKFLKAIYGNDFFRPTLLDQVVQVVQVGQLPVSAAAQNPVSCDTRVSQATDTSPSQCSVENSPHSGMSDSTQSSITKTTEYTELTTADLSMPIVVHDMCEQNDGHPMIVPAQQSTNLHINQNSSSEVQDTEVKSNCSEVQEEDTQNNSVECIVENQQAESQQPSQYNNIDYQFEPSNSNSDQVASEASVHLVFNSTGHQNNNNTDNFLHQKQDNLSVEKNNQIANAMNAAGIATTNTRAHALVNILSQKIIRPPNVNNVQSPSNNYNKTNSINAMAIQQALAQMLPPPLNQTNNIENNHSNQNAAKVLHIVQGKNSGNQITLLDNSQQSVINSPNATQVLHIVQNKSATANVNSNCAQVPTSNAFGGISLVEAGLPQGGNQLLHIVNAGANQNKTNSAGQLLKRVNQMVQFVCKSADGKAIQLNAPHQRSMVLRLQPIESPNVQAPKQTEAQSPSPSVPTIPVSSKENLQTQQEIKSRSVYEENYAKFIQNSTSKPSVMLTEKCTSLPKFNQAFGKAVFQDGNSTPKQIEIGSSNNHVASSNNSEITENTQESSVNLDHIGQISSPPLLIRKSTAQTSQPQQNLVQQIKQTMAPMNIQTMHGGVIYTRQIPVNIGGGQTINLITVPSTELMDDASQKQPSDVKFVNQADAEQQQILKIIPQGPPPNVEVTNEENGNVAVVSENSQPAQTQPGQLLTQMRIKLPMLSKTPQVPGARVVRPSFFQIQRNVITGANQPVYQQLVLTAAPPHGQQTIRLPQPQISRQVKVPSQTAESNLSTSTLEQLREFDMVLEQVKERSTVQPGSTVNSFTKIHSQSNDNSPETCVTVSTIPTEHTQQVLYSIGANQSLNVAYVNRKATLTTSATTAYVRSPDSSGIADSPTSSQMSHSISDSSVESHSKPAKIGSKTVKSRPTKPTPSLPQALKVAPIPTKTSTQKPLEDEQTTQRILYILAEYKEQVENSPDKDKPAPRRRSNPPTNPSGSSKRKKGGSSRRPGGGSVRDSSPVGGDDPGRTMGSEDSSCGTSQGDCTESCGADAHSPQGSPRKVARKLTFEQETSIAVATRPQPQRNVIVADGQTIAVTRGAGGKPATAVLMPANYLLPVSMVKGGQQIAIVTNRGPKLLTMGQGEAGAANALLLQRLIGPAGLKPVLTRPGVRHVRLPTAALHNLQAFNLATASPAPVESTSSPAAPTPPELVDTQATSPWAEHDLVPPEGKADESSGSEGGESSWRLAPSTDTHDYSYEEASTRDDNVDRTVLVVQKKEQIAGGGGYTVHHVAGGAGASGLRHVTHVSAAALRHKYAILEHELRLQKSLSEECEDLGVDSPSASELFPEAELFFAASPAHDHSQDNHHSQTHHVQTSMLNQSGIPQPDIDDQIATDHIIPEPVHMEVSSEKEVILEDSASDLANVHLGLEEEGIVTVSEDGLHTSITLDQEEFARSHPNTTFHSEPTEEEQVQQFAVSGLKGRHVGPTIYHPHNNVSTTVLMATPAHTVISQVASEDPSSTQIDIVKYSVTDIDNMIDAIPRSGHHANLGNSNMTSSHLASVLVKDDGLRRFDSILTDSRELHLSNSASAIVHSSATTTQVIRRVCYEDNDKHHVRNSHFLIDESDAMIAGDDAKMSVAEDSSREATLESMGGDADDDRSSPERHAELFWESNSASERSESRRPLDFSSDSDKCCKSPSLDETNSTDSSGVGSRLRLDTVIKEARRRERCGSADVSSADDTAHPPVRTYPPKRAFQPSEGVVEPERSISGKTRAGERSSPDSPEVRRRASGRGVVKRGCHCCNGSPAPQRPKKPRQRKPVADFTPAH